MTTRIKYFVLLIVMLAGCSSRATEDAVDRVARQFGVPRQRILKVADELGVNSVEIEKFGPYFFPYNYYEYQFESFRLKHGRLPSRSEVDQMVKGYIARCEEDGYGIAYIYYSTHTHSELFGSGEIAMVFGVVFKSPPPTGATPEDPIYDHIWFIDLRDISVNPPEEKYWDKCIQEYMHNH